MMSKAIKPQDNSLIEIKEDFVKILGYIAASCLFLVALFSVITVYLPTLPDEFYAFPTDFHPYIAHINDVLSYAIGTISNWSTYAFLVTTGLISYIGAFFIERGIKRGTETEEKKPEKKAEKKGQKVAVLKAETIDVKEKTKEKTAKEPPSEETKPKTTKKLTTEEEKPVQEEKPESEKEDSPKGFAAEVAARKAELKKRVSIPEKAETEELGEEPAEAATEQPQSPHVKVAKHTAPLKEKEPVKTRELD